MSPQRHGCETPSPALLFPLEGAEKFGALAIGLEVAETGPFTTLQFPTFIAMKVACTIIAAVAAIAITGTAFAAEHVVDQKKNKFVPGNISIKAGDKLTFKNSDRYRHHVGNGDAQMKFSKMMEPGKSFTQLFDKRGDLKCAARCTRP
tara:strand:- start:249 stop:692 length:444 start_codon:yes stop_codon:yes gene_type:complete